MEQIWKSLLVSKETAEKMMSDISTYYEIFLNYCGYGEKINYNKLNYSGYVKFLRDCDLVYDPVVDYEKDRIASIVKAKEKEMKKITGTNSLNKTARQSISFKKSGEGKGGRILESELSIMFQNLTGVKNFDIPDEKAFNHTNKTFNKMYDKTNKNPILGKSSCLQTTHGANYSKMDFKLFVKSFEVIAKKLYKCSSLDKSVMSLLNNVNSLTNKLGHCRVCKE